MTTPSEEGGGAAAWDIETIASRAARDYADQFHYSRGAGDDAAAYEADYQRAKLGILAALASRVSTPPSEQGSCWDEGPTLMVRDGECAPMPPRCELQAGHLGAHRGPRNMHGLATEWMTRPAATPPSEDWEYVGEDRTTRRFSDRPDVAAEWVRRGYAVRRRTKAVRAGAWEPVTAVPVLPTEPALRGDLTEKVPTSLIFPPAPTEPEEKR